MASPTVGIEHHPDIVALRSRYEVAAESRGAHVVTGLMLLTGLYVTISPWVVGFAGQTALATSNFMTGIVMTVLAFGAGVAYERWHGLAWVLPILGAWTFFSPWLIRGETHTPAAVINNVICGAIFAVLGVATLYLSSGRYRVGRAERRERVSERVRR